MIKKKKLKKNKIVHKVAPGLMCVCLCLLSESVPIPEDVRVTSLDMGLVLEWDPPQNTPDTLFNYTAEIRWANYDKNVWQF